MDMQKRGKTIRRLIASNPIVAFRWRDSIEFAHLVVYARIAVFIRTRPIIVALVFALVKRGEFRYTRVIVRGVAQPGSVLRSGRRGHGFESRRPDFVTPKCSRLFAGVFISPFIAVNLPR